MEKIAREAEGKQEVELPSGTMTGEEVGDKGSRVA